MPGRRCLRSCVVLIPTACKRGAGGPGATPVLVDSTMAGGGPFALVSVVVFIN